MSTNSNYPLKFAVLAMEAANNIGLGGAVSVHLLGGASIDGTIKTLDVNAEFMIVTDADGTNWAIHGDAMTAVGSPSAG